MKTSTLLLIAGAGVALYLITRPKAPVLPPGTYPPGYPYPAGYAPPTSNPTIALAGDATSVLNNLFNNIF